MLHNKIYHNFFFEILRTFFLILFGLSLIALTVRAVSFLDLIVDNGYPISIYFKYSILNLFGIIPKFMPLSFFLALIMFVVKHVQDSEFIILWTSGVKKKNMVNFLFLTSTMIIILYLLLSNFLTPYALNKSRQLLSNENFSSFLPTVKTQQFSDTFNGFTFLVEKKLDDEIENIFLHDTGGNLSNLSSNISNTNETTVIAENGIIKANKLFLFNGQIISSKSSTENELISFDQLNINLQNLTTTTIKKPKIQETSTVDLLNCLLKKKISLEFCNNNFVKELLPTLSRRIITPFYIPAIALICSLLLIRSNKIYLNKISIFLYSFSILLFTELAVRYTGLNIFIMISFILMPLIFYLFFYSFLILKFSTESKNI